MPTRWTRKRNPKRAYETVDKPQQIHFTPRNRTVLLKTSSTSTPRTRQQTLTQIDFVSRLLPETEDEDLAYEEEELPRARKRRKTVPETTVEPRKRTKVKKPAKRKYVEKASNGLAEGSSMGENELGKPPQHTRSNVHGDSMALPPETPKKIVKTEIPCSQSPASTALSTQSRRSLRRCSRSPLKERSTNSRTVPQSHSRGIKSFDGIPKLEVSDTYEDETEEIQFPGLISRLNSGEKSRLVTSGMGHCRSLEVTTFIDGYKDNVRSNMPQGNDAAKTLWATRGNVPRIKSGMSYSNSEEAEDGPEEEDFDAGLDTQAAFQHVESLASESSSNNKVDPDSLNTDRAATSPLMMRDAIPVGRGIVLHQNITDERSEQKHPLSSPAAELADYRTRSGGPSSPVPPLHRTDSEQASDQLAADLYYLTQNTSRPLVNTASQIENAFRPYSPPPTLDDDTHHHTATRDLSYHDPNASSPHNLPETSRSPQQPIPPSQATTADITQPSQHPNRITQLRSSSPGPLPSLSSNAPVRGLPAAPFVFSSSPLDGGELSSQYTQLWDGKPLTDSQLLPESLMNISIPPPPGWRCTQESLEEE